jgi:glycosyltransferase involved in cell wall biosynthesis
MSAPVSHVVQRRGTLPRAPRVLLVMTRNQRRGAEVFAVQLADALVERGLRVSACSLSPSHDADAPPVVVLGRTPLAPRTLLRLRAAMRAVDVVVACGSTALPAATLAGWGSRQPLIYQNIGDPMYWAGTGMRHARVRLFLSRASAVAALTERSAELLRTHFHVPAHKIRIIRNARSAREFRPPTPEERSHARRRLGVAEGVKLAVVVGSLTPEKRVDVAIRAIAQTDESVQLVIAGSGSQRSDLEMLAGAFCPGRVRFLGQTDDVRTLLWASDVLLLTSASEGVPGVLIEAGLVGRPVVASDVGFVRDVVVPGETGCLVDVDDVPATAAALGTAIADGRRMGELARDHCVRLFDFDHAADEWAELIRAVGREVVS